MDPRMMFELLERLERLQPRVQVVEPDDVADVYAIAIQVINESAAVSRGIERPAERVLHQAGPHAALG